MCDRDETETVELRLRILDSMMDDAEDIEQVYLCANRNELHAVPTLPRFPLREIIDEMKFMLEEGYIKACFSNDEKQAPLAGLNLSLFHHYWFSPTEKGKAAWQDSSEHPPAN